MGWIRNSQWFILLWWKNSIIQVSLIRIDVLQAIDLQMLYTIGESGELWTPKKIAAFISRDLLNIDVKDSIEEIDENIL